MTGENGGQPTLIRLDPGVTFAQFEKALPAIAADPNNLDGIGAIVMSAMVSKGTSSLETSLAPGQYVARYVAASGVPPLTTFTVTRATARTGQPAPSGRHGGRPSSSRSAVPAGCTTASWSDSRTADSWST